MKSKVRLISHRDLKGLRKADLQLTVEGTIADFLGVSVTNTGDGIHLSQPLHDNIRNPEKTLE